MRIHRQVKFSSHSPHHNTMNKYSRPVHDANTMQTHSTLTVKHFSTIVVKSRAIHQNTLGPQTSLLGIYRVYVTFQWIAFRMARMTRLLLSLPSLIEIISFQWQTQDQQYRYRWVISILLLMLPRHTMLIIVLSLSVTFGSILVRFLYSHRLSISPHLTKHSLFYTSHHRDFHQPFTRSSSMYQMVKQSHGTSLTSPF
jgi:membrane-associated HD superfamily phosphohydrolase